MVLRSQILIHKQALPTTEQALPGRSTPMPVPCQHLVTGHSICPPYPAGLSTAVFAMGCFWGVERLFWKLPGVWATAAGYAGGITPNPTYDEVCSGLTGHTEVVLVIFDPSVISYGDLLQHFWESHDPTQGMRQGNDVGSQYRSAIYTCDQDQLDLAKHTEQQFQSALSHAGHNQITTEIKPLDHFYYAETEHQQYLAKHPNGYCGLRGTGICLPR